MQAQTSTDSNGNEIQAPVPVVQTGQRVVADIKATAQRAIRGNSAVCDDAEVFVSSVRANFHRSELPGVSGLNIGGKLNRFKILGPRSQVFFDRNAIAPLTSNIMEDLMDMQYTGPPGSNIRNEEESVAISWICFLRAAESGRAEINDEITDEKMSLHLQEVLMWLTGARIVPAIGLPRKISVHFCKKIKLPKVSTCGPSLTLPICPETQRGRRSIFVFSKWILDSQGFGQV